MGTWTLRVLVFMTNVSLCSLCVPGRDGYRKSTASDKWEFPTIRGTLFWGPYDKDPTI